MRIFILTIMLIGTLFANKIEEAYILVAQDNVDDNTVKKAYLMAKEDFKDDLYLVDKRYFYIVAASYIVRFQDCKPVNTLQKFYGKVKGDNLMPISYLKAFCLLNDKNATTAKIKLYKQAIKEDSSFDLSYDMLSAIYIDNKQYDLAISTIKDALANCNSNKEMKAWLHYNLADAYIRKRYALYKKGDCIVHNKEGDKLLKLSASEAEKALILNSKILDACAILTESYDKLGYDELALIANRGLKNSKEKVYRFTYESTLIGSGKKDDYLKMAKEHKDGNISYLKAGAYIFDQDWQNALKEQKKVLKEKESDINFYDYLRYAVINYALGKKDEAKNIIKNAPTKSLDKQWEKELKANYLGELSDTELLKKADNVCKQTEANYYIGIKHIANDKAKAKEYFQKVLDLKAYGYVEYKASRYFIKEGLK